MRWLRRYFSGNIYRLRQLEHVKSQKVLTLDYQQKQRLCLKMGLMSLVVRILWEVKPYLMEKESQQMNHRLSTACMYSHLQPVCTHALPVHTPPTLSVHVRGLDPNLTWQQLPPPQPFYCSLYSSFYSLFLSSINAILLPVHLRTMNQEKNTLSYMLTTAVDKARAIQWCST